MCTFQHIRVLRVYVVSTCWAYYSLEEVIKLLFYIRIRKFELFSIFSQSFGYTCIKHKKLSVYIQLLFVFLCRPKNYRQTLTKCRVDRRGRIYSNKFRFIFQVTFLNMIIGFLVFFEMNKYSYVHSADPVCCQLL